MIKIENYEIVGWRHAIRGMRNPKNSWDQSDSSFKGIAQCDILDENDQPDVMNVEFDALAIGPKDHELMMKLRKGGTDDRKYMRMIVVYLDITAPLYWWKEFDTYKVGTVSNSCSTMHKIHAKELAIEDFSTEHLFDIDSFAVEVWSLDIFRQIIESMNVAREAFVETNDKRYWYQIIQMLPTAYNQRRTIMLNYEVLANMYKSRKTHKLDEWREFCKWIESLPYSEIITGPSLKDIPICNEIMNEAKNRVEKEK